MSEKTTAIKCNQSSIPQVYEDRASKQTRFEALVYTLSTDLYRYAFWLCRGQDRAEDLVQETFLRAWRSLDSLRDDKAAKGWLITILRREHARGYERPALEIDPRVEPDDLIGEPQGATPDTLPLYRARASAVRGMPSRSAISPKTSPGPIIVRITARPLGPVALIRICPFSTL